MALIASIGCADLDRQVRPRNAQAMIPPRVNDHVRLLRHVAIHAECAAGTDGVMVVQRCVVLASGMLVATGAGLVARVFKFGCMRIMAIGAFNVFAKHLALQKRAVFENFVSNLTIVVVEIPVDELHHFVIGQRLARFQAGSDQRTAGVALAACIDLRPIVGVFKIYLQALAVAPIPKKRILFSQFDMQAPRPMTCFATHVDFAVGRFVGI